MGKNNKTTPSAIIFSTTKSQVLPDMQTIMHFTGQKNENMLILST